MDSGSHRRYTASGKTAYTEGGREPAWEEPLVGFSRGDDPLTGGSRTISALFSDAAGNLRGNVSRCKPRPGELTVISGSCRRRKRPGTNTAGKRSACRRWARSRNFGEVFNMKLRDHVVGVLREAGHEAVAPMKSPLWRQEKSARYDFASTWSERHAAYASGLGTFGLCDGLITPGGRRCDAAPWWPGSPFLRRSGPTTTTTPTASLISTAAAANASSGARPARSPGRGMTRRNASTTSTKSRNHTSSPDSDPASPCGLCQTGVPCEVKIPVPGKTG